MSLELDRARPSPGAADPAALSALLPVYRPPERIFVAGRGVRLLDAEGREYLDFVGGIGVNALGYGDAGVAAVVAEALDAGLIHTSNLYRTEPAEALAAELVARSFADRVFFCNSGAEANEAAFKFARRRAGAVGGPAKHEIVALAGAFHGRLFGALSATDRPAFRAPFEPLLPGVRFIDPADEAAAAAVISRERTAAIIAEPVQGEGGIRPLDDAVLRRLRAWADQADAALVFDEVQCGLGRTGHLFAFEQAGVIPDIVTLAKPLAGGLPMGAVLLNDRIAAAVRPGDHATTFGGGPLVSRVALEVLRRVADPAFLTAVRRKGGRLLAALEPLVRAGRVRAVRGRGLMWGIELNSEAAPVVRTALEAGLLVTTAGERVVRLLPPLVIDDADLAAGIRLLSACLP